MMAKIYTLKKLCCRKENNNELHNKNQTNNEWELKSDDVTICEELGHGAFGKVCKGIMNTSSCLPQGLFVHKKSKKQAKLTTTVAVKMLQGRSLISA